MRALTISLLGLLAAIHISVCDGLNSNVLCVERERQALLKFKKDLIDPSNRLSSWVESEDCCEWMGIVCNNSTGHVNRIQLGILLPGLSGTPAEWDTYYRSMLGGKINPSLLDLNQLSFLDLSNNDFGGEIPKFIGSLKSLTYLNLSGENFQGEIPHQLGNLSNLQYLDLGSRYPLEAKTLQWVSGLSSLRYLDLFGTDLSKATDWMQVTTSLLSLVELHLSCCNLIYNDSSPLTVSVNYTSLDVLDLYRNQFTSVPTWILSLPSLVSIDLGGNSLSSIPSQLSNLNKLQFLGLKYVGLQGNFPCVIGNLTSLTHLDLSWNNLEMIEPKCLESLNNLREMDLSFNNIDQKVSEIIDSLTRLEHLESLNLEFNKLSSQLTDQLAQFSLLKFFDVSDNQLNGSLPTSLGQLGNLEYLDVSNNMLEGNISEIHFSNLTKLRVLRASNYMLTFKPNPSWIPPFRCKSIRLRNWQLGPQFPQWLYFQKSLSILDISNAGISGVVPNWIWKLSTEFRYVNFSHNQLMGEISSYLEVNYIVDLSRNQFTGQVPQVSSDLACLVLSKNSFSGSLSNFLCNSSNKLTSLRILEIESNLLSGEIPDCWENWGNLRVLNLGKNNLNGKIPTSLGSMKYVQALNLHDNSLLGDIPPALQNLTYMVALDLRKNQFTGSIPAWIGYNLSCLLILNLRSNNFQGQIPNQICALPNLQILDLGNNEISGAIPKCLSNLTSMATENDQPMVFTNVSVFLVDFILRTMLVMKGREDEYSTTLGLVTSIDLSVNSLTGDVPKELGNITWLRSLNLSGNLLTGKIPQSIGNMGVLETLDLSKNRFHGEIPPSLSKLNFLNHLNLSYNNLTGQIPSGTQLQSFDMFCYIGNHLCGPPLTENCSTSGETPNRGSSRKGKKGFKVNSLYVSIVLGFVMGFWGVVAPLLFIRSWRITYYRKLEQIGDKIYVFWATIGK